MILELLTITIYGVLLLINNFLSIIIIKHNNKKALGFQTLFDRLINKTLIAALILSYEFSTISYIQIFPVPLSPIYSKIIFYINNFLHNHIIIWVISIISFKYLAIFHPSWVDFESEDRIIARNFQVTNLTVLAVLYSFEQIFFSNVAEETTVYNLLSGNTSESGKKGGLTGLSKFLLMTLISVFCYTQFKIERKFSRQVNDLVVQELDNSYINKKVLRICLVLSVLIVSFNIYTVPIIVFSNEFILLVTGVMLFVLHMILPHLLFIWKSSETLKTSFMKSLRRILYCNFQGE